MSLGEDDALRREALRRLGALGDPLAREALEHGLVNVERDARTWEGSAGTMHGQRVTLRLAPELRARVVARHAAMDALHGAIAAAIAARPLETLADLQLESEQERRPVSPYRGGGPPR